MEEIDVASLAWLHVDQSKIEKFSPEALEKKDK
jgi:hypothetical protein